MENLYDPSKLYWITVNVCQSSDLATGNALFTSKAHRALKLIVDDINDYPLPAERFLVWGAREVEPLMQPDGSVIWQFHWHLLAYLGSVAAPSKAGLASRLRNRWPEPRAVRIDDLRGKTPLGLQWSLAKISGYVVKQRYTYNAGSRREWLPPRHIADLAQFKQACGARWSRFKLGSARRKKGTSSS